MFEPLTSQNWFWFEVTQHIYVSIVVTCSALAITKQKIQVGKIFCSFAKQFLYGKHEILLDKMYFYGIQATGRIGSDPI
jgi:hypothetical protein